MRAFAITGVTILGLLWCAPAGAQPSVPAPGPAPPPPGAAPAPAPEQPPAPPGAEPGQPPAPPGAPGAPGTVPPPPGAGQAPPPAASAPGAAPQLPWGPAPTPPPGAAPPPGPAGPPAGAARPASAPPAQPTSRAKDENYHTGFFLRFGVGPGYFRAKSWLDDSATRNFTGWTASWQMAIGGSSDGFGVAAVLMGDRVFELTADQDGDELDVSRTRLNLMTLNSLFFVYPDPEDGLWLGAALGLSSLDQPEVSDSPDGPSVSLMAGYEWWQGKAVSIGVAGRLTWGGLEVTDIQPSFNAQQGTSTTPTDRTTAVQPLVFGLALTASYN